MKTNKEHTLNYEQLGIRIRQTEDDLFRQCTVYDEVNKWGLIDNGSNVLAVVHLDVSGAIVGKRNEYHYIYDDFEAYVYSPSLDDRLGLYICLDLLPEMGVNVDVLLTTNEEIGASTAAFFKTDKKYNWMFQFDRRGSEVVMYEYEDPQMCELLDNMGFKVGIGTFSDICMLGGLNIKGFNFGTFYYHEHSLFCYADVYGMLQQVEAFAKFYFKYSDTHFPHTGYTSRRWNYRQLPYQTDAPVEELPWEDVPQEDVWCDYCGITILDDDGWVYIKELDALLCDHCKDEVKEWLY